jgi:hypothetical protein
MASMVESVAPAAMTAAPPRPTVPFPALPRPAVLAIGILTLLAVLLGLRAC